MKRRTIELLIGVVVILVLAGTAALFNNFLGAGLIKKGSPRLAVHQGDKVTLELAVSDQVRKLEICTEKRNLFLGYSDFNQCRTLKYFVAAGARFVDTTIPRNFPLARAVVITRLRDKAGTLVPAAPTDEKIALWITKARPIPVLNFSNQDNDDGDNNEGSDGGGGERDSSDGNNNSSNNNLNQPNNPPPATTPDQQNPLELTYVRMCWDKFQGQGYPAIRFAWESNNNVPDTDVHLMTKEEGESIWFDWWDVFSTGDSNYGSDTMHHNGANKMIRTDVSQGYSGGGLKPNTSYNIQYQTADGRALTEVITIDTTNGATAQQTGISMCRDNIIYETGTTLNKAGQVIILAQNKWDRSNYKGYFSLNPRTKMMWLNPNPSRTFGEVPLQNCGPVTNADYSEMANALANLESQLPMDDGHINGRNSSPEQLIVYFDQGSEYGAYGTQTSQYPTALRPIRNLMYSYASKYCGSDLPYLDSL